MDENLPAPERPRRVSHYVCPSCGNTELPDVITPGCDSCRTLAGRWHEMGRTEHLAAEPAEAPVGRNYLCTTCGNRELPRSVTPGCRECRWLVDEWSTLGEVTAYANAELFAAAYERKGDAPPFRKLPFGPRDRVLRPRAQLDKWNPGDWSDLMEHWRRSEEAGLARRPTGPAITAAVIGLLIYFALPDSVGWIGLTMAGIALLVLIAPWWWLG